METILSLLTLLCIVLLIVGLFNPNVSLFWYKKERTRIMSFLFYGVILLICFFIIGVTATDVKQDLNKTPDSAKNKPVDTSKQIYTLTKKDYTKYFYNKWDSVQVVKEDGLPQYTDYHSRLDSVTEEMLTISKLDSASSKTIKKLRLKFLNSEKFKKASYDWLTYGNANEVDLFAACESAFDHILDDPASLDIIDKRVTKQSKHGWIVVIRYRAKNAFGAKVLQMTAFEVRYSVADNAYYVNNFY